MNIGQTSSANGDRRRIEATRGKLEHDLNLLPRHMKLLDNFFDARTRLQVLELRSHRHPGVPEHPRAAASVRHAFYAFAFRPVESRHVPSFFYGSFCGGKRT